jgi:hypothetical protein
MPLGSRLEGLVLALAARGAAQIRTEVGTLDVRTPAPLAKGAGLALVLKSLTPRVQLQIADAGRPSPDSAPQPLPDAATVRGVPAITVGARLTATLTRPAPWISGTTVQPVTPQPVTAQPAPPGPVPANPPSTLPAGSQLALRIVAMQPPAIAPSAAAAASFEPTALAAGRSLPGTVIGATPAGQPILRTTAGVLTLATAAAALPRGTVLTVEITGVPSLPSAPPSAAPAGVKSPVSGIPLPGEDVLGSTRWPALTEAVEALHAVDPAAARQLAEAVLPRPDARLTTAVLFFLSALRGGDLRGWLGDATVRALNRTRPDLSIRLGDDFRAMARAADEPAANDWRVTQVPLFTGAEIEMIRLWARRQDDPADAEDDNPQHQAQRFVVDVSLSRLGRLQLDGLVRDAGRRLDLIVRSESPLPAAIRDRIRGLFEDTGAFTGLTGGVGFQAAPPNFVDLAAKPAAGRQPGVIV